MQVNRNGNGTRVVRLTEILHIAVNDGR
jgi:hypothetical protein